jgi:hypothetical protein
VPRLSGAAAAAIGLAIGCGSAPPPRPVAAETAPPSEGAAIEAPPGDSPQLEQIAAASPRTTVRGARFVVPAGWRLVTSGMITVLDVDGEDVHVAIVDADGADAHAAVASAWGLYRSTPMPALAASGTGGRSAKGWDELAVFWLDAAPAGAVPTRSAMAMRADAAWTVVIVDAPGLSATREAEIARITDSLRPPPS